MNKKTIFCLLAILAASCNHQKKELKFNTVEGPKYEIIDSILKVGIPLNFVAYKNKLFIADFENPMIINYNIEKREVENRFFNIGRGPSESMPPIMLYINKNDNKLYSYSKQAFTLGCHEVTNFVDYHKEFKVSYKYQNVIPINSGKYLASGYFNDGRFQLLNSSGDIEYKFGKFPSFAVDEEKIPDDSKTIFHQVMLALKPSQDKVAALSSHVLEIIDIVNNNQKIETKQILLSPYEYTYSSGKYLFANLKEGYVKGSISLTCDDEKIYVLFNNGTESDNIPEILVFDWNGNPEKRITLEKNFKMITVDENGIMYGLYLSRENYGIAKFY